MTIKISETRSDGHKITIFEGVVEIAHAYLYILYNDLHDQPFGFLEDVFVLEAYRGKGYAKELIKQIFTLAKERRCYKIVATSRYKRKLVHRLYSKLGFTTVGKEFRIDLLI